MSKTASDRALAALQELLNRHKEDLSAHVADGACKDYAEYMRSTGMIIGLAMAERELLNLDERIEQT